LSGLNFTSVFNGSGFAVTAGQLTYIQAPRTCTITSVSLFSDVNTTASLDIWKDTFANYPPTIADSIVASAPPTLTATNKFTTTTLTGWTTSITAGDVLGFYVTSNTAATQLILQLTTA
jgi:hypothetical protein